MNASCHEVNPAVVRLVQSQRSSKIAAADGITALLDGQGGDELFGFSPYLVADRVRHGRLLSSLRLARSFPNLGHTPPWRHTLHLWRRFGFNAAFLVMGLSYLAAAAASSPSQRASPSSAW